MPDYLAKKLYFAIRPIKYVLFFPQKRNLKAGEEVTVRMSGKVKNRNKKKRVMSDLSGVSDSDMSNIDEEITKLKNKLKTNWKKVLKKMTSDVNDPESIFTDIRFVERFMGDRLR